MQCELNKLIRLIRINWVFRDKCDKRTEMEIKFYEKSTWEPPAACKELEDFIKNVQTRFDKWTPPRFIKDNLTKGERNFKKKMRENTNFMYMVEDKGPSFTKMSKDQYIKAGEKELENPKFYKTVEDDKSDSLKEKK